MFSKLLLILRTVSHLKWNQACYQLWYRVKSRFIHLARYNRYVGSSLQPVIRDPLHLIPCTGKYLSTNEFCFLNLSHHFEHKVDWSYSGHGKLWNYNLQYFDYLHDSAMAMTEKERLLEDFSTQLLEGKVPVEPYPVSLRLINWIIFYSRTGYQSLNFEKALKCQVDYLYNNPEFHVQANHLMENYIAIVFSGIALNDAQLSAAALDALRVQMDEQILSDGAHYECSPMYHSILLGKLLLLTVAIEQTGQPLDISLLRDKISDMLGWLEAFCFTNGEWAHVNDATAGIAPAVIDIKTAAQQAGLEANRKKLGASGYRKLSNSRIEALIDVGNIIPAYQPGHAHSDMLHFSLQCDAIPVLVDTGTSTYQSNSLRASERSTPAHNTVSIDGRDQSEVWGSFRVARRANLDIEKETETFISASHSGYQKEFGIVHRRSFDIESGSLIIKDDLCGSSAQNNANPIAYFHCDHRINVLLNADQSITMGSGITMHFEGYQKIELFQYEQALGFNLLQKATCIKVWFLDSLKTSIIPS